MAPTQSVPAILKPLTARRWGVCAIRPLAKLFAVEYAGWFAVMLPGMARLGIPIPLGGTSNHFRTSTLRQIGGWDAYNVTEDADVGFRLARAGHRAAPLNSVTWEEAVSTPIAWLKQRSRWTKGYMQTALVHMREPHTFARSVGWMRYLTSILFLGGAALAPLIGGPMWLLFVYWLAFGGAPDGTAYLALFGGSLVFGTGALTVLTMLGPLRTGEDRFAMCGAFSVVYWLMMSGAAWWGLFELVAGKSSLWRKTAHGVVRRPGTQRLTLVPRLASAPAVAMCVLAFTSFAAFGNPWLKPRGGGEVVGTVRAIRSIEAFAHEPLSDAAFDLHGEYGISNGITLVTDNEVKGNGGDGAHLEFSDIGARVALARWDTGVISLQGEFGAGEIRDANGSFRTAQGVGEARALLGQDFDLWGNHSWIAIEAGYRWRAGPPADEALLDLTLGVQPRDDLFFMLQSFGIDTVTDATGGYRAFKSDKLQLSVVYEVIPRIWIQAGGVASVYGDDAGNAGGMLALWWRF